MSIIEQHKKIVGLQKMNLGRMAKRKSYFLQGIGKNNTNERMTPFQ
jgi:hypothetical protein